MQHFFNSWEILYLNYLLEIKIEMKITKFYFTKCVFKLRFRFFFLDVIKRGKLDLHYIPIRNQKCKEKLFQNEQLVIAPQ